MNFNVSKGCLRFPQLKQTCIRLLSTSESSRRIANSIHVSPSTVQRIKKRLEELGIKSADEITPLSPGELYKKIYNQERNATRSDSKKKLIPDFEDITNKMIESKQKITEAYSDYCSKALKEGLNTLSLQYFSARVKIERDRLKQESPEFYYAQSYPYGLYVQLDYTGDKYELLTYNGRITCWIMAMAFPASYYIYAGFVTSQSTAESCRVLGDGLKAIGNRHPSIVVVDNARCWCNRHGMYGEAIINENFASYLHELGMCAEAAPPYKPQRKSCVEHSVGRIEDLMKSLKHDFATNLRTLSEHNKVLIEKINTVINQGPFRRSCKLTRDFLFKQYELPVLIPAKKIPEYMGEPLSVVVPNSYLVTVNAHQYSVPYLYIKKRVEIYETNDLVIIKHEGKEIARHLRQDGEGISAKEEHKPAVHQNIDANNKIYATTDDVLQITKGLDEGLYKFCCCKVESDKNRGRAESVTIKTCRAVINAYKRFFYKQFYSEACISVLNQDPIKWNSYEIESLYKGIIKEFEQTKKVQHQEDLEIFRPKDQDEAHLRNDVVNDNLGE